MEHAWLKSNGGGAEAPPPYRPGALRGEAYASSGFAQWNEHSHKKNKNNYLSYKS
jgi:hypothetical protein